MKLRKLTSLLLSALMLMSLTACGGKSNSSAAADSAADPVSAAADSEAAEQPSGEPAGLERSDPMNITTAADLVAQMRIGWNLGNTLDANGSNDLDSETSWSNPVTTKEMIDEVSKAGFNVIRIPTSWGNHVDEDWNIDPAWMDRVQEVVNYGYDNGMFVLLNTHHEEWYMPKEANAEEDMEHLGRIWEQIAERFRNYGERLLFEGLNEPRLRDTNIEWTGNDEARGVINRYEQKFVDTVRATGGNNEKRALIISPYAASSMPANLQAVKVPENAGNIVVSVHAYLPYNFALNVKGTPFYTNDGSIDSLMKSIKTIFLDKGLPVIITEFGCMNKQNLDERMRNVEDYLTAATAIGVPCVWWDNGYVVGTQETFGIFDRETLSWSFPPLNDKMMELTKERAAQDAPAAA